MTGTTEAGCYRPQYCRLTESALDELRTGDLVRVFPRAAQQVASRLGIDREAARIDGVHAGDRGLVEAVAQHRREVDDRGYRMPLRRGDW